MIARTVAIACLIAAPILALMGAYITLGFALIVGLVALCVWASTDETSGKAPDGRQYGGHG
jgi:hypothetical protein